MAYAFLLFNRKLCSIDHLGKCEFLRQIITFSFCISILPGYSNGIDNLLLILLQMYLHLGSVSRIVKVKWFTIIKLCVFLYKNNLQFGASYTQHISQG